MPKKFINNGRGDWWVNCYLGKVFTNPVSLIYSRTEWSKKKPVCFDLEKAISEISYMIAIYFYVFYVKNKCSDWSTEVKLPALLVDMTTNRQTGRPIDRPGQVRFINSDEQHSTEKVCAQINMQILRQAKKKNKQYFGTPCTENQRLCFSELTMIKLGSQGGIEFHLVGT